MITWCPPSICTPPHAVARPDQVVDLANAFLENGWDPEQPALVGYPWEGGVQLLSGSHRYAAAVKAGLIFIPVHIWPFKAVETYWGTHVWAYIMAAPRAGRDFDPRARE